MADNKTQQKIRCAIYTRKSTDEGLEQEFNSLDAQYEACAAYIASQKHEGWESVRKRYDDGGISGGTMERAGLLALLNDIDAGLVDMIVVYKIDRLTRSLSDFSKIVDRLDAKGASFVSVTQSFNTATSMGRLTLNMLLSFAQFEREVTAERIRDKIAASKAKGMWMGGTVPMGYDPNPDKNNVRGLIVNKEEAADIHRIFEIYDRLGNLRETGDEVAHLGIRSKRRQYKSGKRMGGSIMSRGQIHHILTNPIYIGKIRHKDQIHEGQHAAIIDEELWERVQEKLTQKSPVKRGDQYDCSSHAPLMGKLFDETGDLLTPAYTKKSDKTHRYYISSRLYKGKDPNAWRLPAKMIEEELMKIVSAHLNEKAESEMPFSDSVQRSTISNEGLKFIKRVDLAPDQITISFNEGSDARGVIELPMRLRKRGVERKLIIGEAVKAPEPNLIKTLAQAHDWVKELKAGKAPQEIMVANNLKPGYFRRRLKLATLSPKIQKAIIEGKQAEHITLTYLVTQSQFPLDWNVQEQQLGFTS